MYFFDDDANIRKNYTVLDEWKEDCDFDLDDDPNLEEKWYVVHTYSGHEKKVKSSIEKIVESKGMGDKILKINVPTHKMVVVKNGTNKEETKSKIIFPGYVFVKMIHNDQTWFLVRNTRGVTGFVGAGTKPTSLTKKEIVDMVDLLQNRVSAEFEVGDKVIITTGFLKDSEATVLEVYPDKKMLKLLISLMNKEAETEQPFSGVTKIID